MLVGLRKTPYGRWMAIMMDFRQAASHTAPSPISRPLKFSRPLCLTTGIVMDLVCPLKQLLCARHAVVRTTVPMGVTRALRTESDGKSDRIQTQL